MSLPFYRVIKGNFVIINKEPDADSIRFVAKDPNLYQPLQYAYLIYKKINKTDGSLQLRLEAVDAPEVHYGKASQPLGVRFRDQFLDWMGFRNIKFEDEKQPNRVTSAEPDTIPGAILSKSAEVNGRPISYLLLAPDVEQLRGNDGNPVKDGDSIEVNNQVLQRTINYRLIEQGLAFYTVYTSTPFDHRMLLRGVALDARKARRGVWDADVTTEFVLDDPDSIGPNGQLILPKLFRRCTDYLKAVAGGFSGNLTEWLTSTSASISRQEDDQVVVNDSLIVRLSSLVIQSNRTIIFQTDPLDIMFVEK